MREAPIALLRRNFRQRFIGAVTIALVLPASYPARAAQVDELKALLAGGRAAEAYQLGKKSPNALGKPEFDFYFGMAAIDAGAVGEGVLALERYLLNNPGSVSARLELGRGYFLLGDNARARDMFAEVEAQSPPPDVAAKLSLYKNAIRQKEAAYKTAVSGFVEAGVARDSNVNSGVSEASIEIPIFGSITLSDDSRKQAATMGSVAAGVQVNAPLTPRLSIFGGLSADTRQHRDLGSFDQRNLGGAFGVNFKEAQNQFRFSTSAGMLDVNGARYRSSLAATAEWNRALGEKAGLGLYVQTAGLIYEGDNRIRDARLTVLGLNWRHAFALTWQPFLTVAANVGREKNSNGRDDLARSLQGARAGVGVTPAARVSASLALSWQQSRYDAIDPFFDARRRDQNTGMEAAMGYMFTPALGLRLEASHFKNRANIGLFAFSRNLVALKLRYDFK